MGEYWNEIWSDPDIDEYIGYVNSYLTWKPKFLEIFKQKGVKSVCDAACGFGAYSVMSSKNGFEVSGFDISSNSIHLTERIMNEFDCTINEYKTCSITNIKYDDSTFCAAIAHAVIDHLPSNEAKAALNELIRIIVEGGLLYLSFDPLSDEDERKKHILKEDGCRIYEDGLLFRYYTDDDIYVLLNGRKIIYCNTNSRGEREYIIQK